MCAPPVIVKPLPVGRGAHLFACAVGLLWCCTTLAQVRGRTIVMAVEDDWAPYAWVANSSSGAPVAVGFSVDAVRAAFATQGVRVEFMPVPFARCLALAKTSAVAGCFNTSMTEYNRHEYLWHEPPLLAEELAIFGLGAQVPKSELGLAALEGRRVGVTNGYTYPVELINNSVIEKVTVLSDENQLRMLVRGRVDFAILNGEPGRLRIHRSDEFRGRVVRVGSIGPRRLRVAFSKTYPDGDELVKAFGLGLLQIMADGSYQRLLEESRNRR